MFWETRAQPDGRTIAVTVAQGEDEPILFWWNSDFYIKPSQNALNAVQQLSAGASYTRASSSLTAAGWRQRIVNPTYMRNNFPDVEDDFKIQFSNFKECKVEQGVIRTCSFVFFTDGPTNLDITTDVRRLGLLDGVAPWSKEETQYELTIKDWAVR